MPPTWNNYRYNPFRSSLRNGSVFRATLCVLVFFGILQWSNLATNVRPKHRNDRNHQSRTDTYFYSHFRSRQAQQVP